MNDRLPQRKILIVDDDDDIREALGEVLEDLGYDIVQAENGERALAIVRAMREPPQLILLDLMMPVMSGAEFLREHHRDRRIARIPVVVMTAALDASVNEFRLAGHLKKPVSYDQLVSLVKAQYA